MVTGTIPIEILSLQLTCFCATTDVVNNFGLDARPFHYELSSLSKAGIKKALEKSAAYPRDFGLAVAALVSRKGRRPSDDKIDFIYPYQDDHLGSLNDFRRGPKKAWWKTLASGSG